MLKITSRDNQKIKLARKVRDRTIDNLIFIEGIRLAEEALSSDLKIAEMFFTEDFADHNRGREFLQNASHINQTVIAEKIFDSLSDTKNSQGIIVIGEKPQTNKLFLEQNLSTGEKLPLVILLHQINNPTNLGAILRTCEAVNVSGVILTKNSADVFSPKALRGAMGASLRLPLWINTDYTDALDWATRQNLISVCADVRAKKSYLEIDWKTPRLLVFGSEGHGLSEEEQQAVDESILIPMENNVESLNLAVSCAVILFEAKRQFQV